MKDTQTARVGQHLPATGVVRELASLTFVGNIIPAAWFQHPLLKTSGKSPKIHTNAVLILSEIIYWYRPIQTKDEATGREKLYRKFKGDKLQKSYQQLADYFGLTKKQVRDAIAFLKERGVITVELRDLPGFSNVMFLEPVVAKVKEIGEVESDVTESHSEVTPSASEVTPSALQVTPSDLKVETYTKTSTKTTTKNTQHTAPQPPTAEPARANVCVSDEKVKQNKPESRFNLSDCRRYAEHLKATGQGIINPGGYATKIHRTGEADELIETFLSVESFEQSALPDAREATKKKLESIAKGMAESGKDESTICASLVNLGKVLMPDEVNSIARQAVLTAQFQLPRRASAAAPTV